MQISITVCILLSFLGSEVSNDESFAEIKRRLLSGRFASAADGIVTLRRQLAGKDVIPFDFAALKSSGLVDRGDANRISVDTALKICDDASASLKKGDRISAIRLLEQGQVVAGRLQQSLSRAEQSRIAEITLANEPNSSVNLHRAATTAYLAGDLKLSLAHALELIRKISPVDSYGLHQAHTLAGLCYYSLGDAGKASDELVASISLPTKGWSRGPSMTLAAALLLTNRVAVADFIRLGGLISDWRDKNLASGWQKTVVEGGTPDFGINGRFDSLI